jgi:hypothetical protein
MTKFALDAFPLWLLLILTVGVVLASIEAGYRLALRMQKDGAREGGAPIGSVIGGTLGLLGFILAFTFQLAATKFEERRSLVLDEVNALGTCYLRTDFVEDPAKTEIRKFLREYVHVRAGVLEHAESLPEILARSEAIQDELWRRTVAVDKGNADSELFALFVQSLNEVIDDHTKRVTIVQHRIPTIVWLALYAVCVLSMAGVGYHFGRAGSRDLWLSILLATAFSIIFGLIADLDRTTEGYLQVSQRPMIELDAKLQKSVLSP